MNELTAAKSNPGVLVISHGSRDPKWVRLVDEALLELEIPENVPIVAGYLELVEGQSIQDGIDALERQQVTDLIVIPLFVSSGSTHIDEIRYAFGVQAEPTIETDLEPFQIRSRIHFTAPLDDDPSVVQILLEHLQQLSRQPDAEVMLLVAHGSKEQFFFTKWYRALKSIAIQLQQQGKLAAVETAMLLPNQVPCKIKVLTKKYPQHSILVLPLFLSEGYFTRTVIPSRLEGYPHRYEGKALLPHPRISRWIESKVSSVLETIQ